MDLHSDSGFYIGDLARISVRMLREYREIYGEPSGRVLRVVFIEDRGSSWALHLQTSEGQIILANPEHCQRAGGGL